MARGDNKIPERHRYFPDTRFRQQQTGSFIQKLPTKDEIVSEIELARKDAIEYLQFLGVSVNPEENIRCDLTTKQLSNKKGNKKENQKRSMQERERSPVHESLLHLFENITLNDCSKKQPCEEITPTSEYVKVKTGNDKTIVVKKPHYAGLCLKSQQH